MWTWAFSGLVLGVLVRGWTETIWRWRRQVVGRRTRSEASVLAFQESSPALPSFALETKDARSGSQSAQSIVHSTTAYLLAFLLPPAGVEALDVLDCSSAGLFFPLPLAPFAGFPSSTSSSFSTRATRVVHLRPISTGVRLLRNQSNLRQTSGQRKPPPRSEASLGCSPERRELGDVALDLLERVFLADAVLGDLAEEEAVLVLRVRLALRLVRVLDLEELKRKRNAVDLLLD